MLFRSFQGKPADICAEDFQEIRQNIEKGFNQTKDKIVGFLGDFMKKMDGEPDRYDQYGNEVHDRQHMRPSQSSQQQQYGSRRSAEARRSADHNRYDNDNRVLGDDFEALELRDDEGNSHHT